MAYGKVKTWIAAEVLTASDLNDEFSNNVTNENDLGTKLTAEITTRTTLESEYDTFYAAAWNSGDSQIKNNVVALASMKDNSVDTPELVDLCVTHGKVAAANKDGLAGLPCMRTLGTGALQAVAGNDSRFETIPNEYVNQAKLKTSQGSVSVTAGSNHLTLPGGEYGFYPQVKGAHVNSPYTLDASFANAYITTTSYVTLIYLNSPTSGETGYAQQRYITSSGEVHWIFILRDKVTKKISSTWQSPDHPCFGNGGKPLLVPHPFGGYDKTKYEIIVINPTSEEIAQMELETIVEDETKSDKDLLEVIVENYEIDEGSNPAWPLTPVTVGLPKHIKNKEGKKVLADYRFMGKDSVVEPIKKVIPCPSYVLVKSLRKQ